MRILLDQVVHDHRNQGNNAMLEIALQRFRKFWPNADFQTMSIAPHICRVYFPDTTPVSPVNLSEPKSRIDVLHRILPRSSWRLLFDLRQAPAVQNVLQTRRQFGHIGSRKHGGAVGNGHKRTPSEHAESDYAREDYANFIGYDLYVPTGGHYMCDSDKRFLMPLLDRLEAANAKGVLTVMVGQGGGPIDDPEIQERARQVLPKVDCLLIREEKSTRPLLHSLGVPPEKVLMTGDDAIELAYRVRKKEMGNGIGLSLRVAAYTNFSQNHINTIRPAIFAAARRYDAELIAAPIGVNDGDKEFVDELMKGYGKTSASWKLFESVSEIIERISRCRIMITGTFHGAVFAISQGIPVIGLANSVEYRNKLAGLADEFGPEGCQIVMPKEGNLEASLSKAIDFAWSSAEQLRPRLLQNAKRQIDLGQSAYEQVFSLVQSRIAR